MPRALARRASIAFSVALVLFAGAGACTSDPCNGNGTQVCQDKNHANCVCAPSCVGQLGCAQYGISDGSKIIAGNLACQDGLCVPGGFFADTWGVDKTITIVPIGSAP